MLSRMNVEVAAQSLNYINKPMLKALNISLFVKESIGAINPRHTSKGIWVGLDVHIPRNLNHAETIGNLAASYFNKANEDINSVIWVPVFKNEKDGHVTYEVSDYDKDGLNEKHRHHDETCGFVYLNKAELDILNGEEIKLNDEDMLKLANQLLTTLRRTPPLLKWWDECVIVTK